MRRKGLLSKVAGAAILAIAFLASSAVAQVGASNASQENVAGILAANGDLSTLNEAVRAAGLQSALTGAGPYTVFAPTNEAFSDLPSYQLDELMANQSILRTVVEYHVVPARVASTELRDGTFLGTLLPGYNLSVNIEGGETFINGARIVQPDIAASNGIVHTIDRVLSPTTTFPTAGITNTTFPQQRIGEGNDTARVLAGERQREIAEGITNATMGEQTSPSARQSPGFEVILTLLGLGSAAALLARRRL